LSSMAADRFGQVGKQPIIALNPPPSWSNPGV
jgi:hypothetical protein